MKKLALLLVLAMAMPAMAAVTFTAEDAGDGVLRISYTGDQAVRGVALKITLDNGTIDLAGEATVNPSFNTFIDYAYSNPMNFNIGDGHPFAKVGEPGALTEETAEFVVSMGVLDEDGDETLGEAGPTSATPLIEIPLKGDGEINVTICADTLRGPESGVVGDAAIASNLEAACIAAVVVPGPSLCGGDANQDGRVTNADISALVSYFLNNRNFLGVAPINAAGYTTEMDTTGDGSITNADISKLVSWFLNNRNFLGVAPCGF